MSTIYLRFRNRHYAKPDDLILLKDIAQIVAPKELENKIKELPIHQITPEDQHLVVIDMMKVVKIIKQNFEVDVRNIGQPEIIVEILTKLMLKKPNLIAVLFVWILLFVGSGVAIMNFHHDVSMQEVHKRLYYLITGIEKERPLLLQIPYSFGIGLGMILFFNHVFKKKINEEPSPLEVEMFLYQQNLDQYVFLNENTENRKRI
ncbi:stage V sporulation protein AA [Tepidibacillus fermentans]|uniref:Stage V sporulation protein AA n=2 Tax=Tepidibacillus fermentans TaxID=1281767 RepID=A0A4R3KJY0_9BACI|nr:stage V sporulation protein AA [Tepidibacillus fermentans]